MHARLWARAATWSNSALTDHDFRLAVGAIFGFLLMCIMRMSRTPHFYPTSSPFYESSWQAEHILNDGQALISASPTPSAASRLMLGHSWLMRAVAGAALHVEHLWPTDSTFAALAGAIEVI